MFQSQTGSQALSDIDGLPFSLEDVGVSIPNGKPGPLRHTILPPAREATSQFQSQTGSQALSDEYRLHSYRRAILRFNPKREARPSQTAFYN